MSAKIAIVTGSNKGIGYAIVEKLCKQFDGIVYLTSRDINRGKAAVESLNKLGLKPAFHQLDIEDENSIQTLANFIKEKHGGIDVLVNNAAIVFRHRNPTLFVYEVEKTIKINYFSTYKVCEILFPLLKPHARVVNISSFHGHLSHIPGDKLKKKLSDPNLTIEELNGYMESFVEAVKCGDFEEKGWPNGTINSYIVSKVGLSALTRIYHQKFMKDPREDIVINHVHPGYVMTDMTEKNGIYSPEQGADAPTYLALLPEGTTSPKGDYVWQDRTIVNWLNDPIAIKYLEYFIEFKNKKPVTGSN